MDILQIIEKKKQNIELSKAELSYFITNYLNNTIPDYQASALLMAIYFNGMSNDETYNFTELIKDSGDVIDLSSVKGHKVDKHSTGGVGDKLTLVIGPIVAACGVPFAKMSGRGLGHTGGTIDKLESIPGFNTSISNSDFISQVNNIGIAIVGQTGNLCPADKKIYALRDTTCTVDSIPCIASSIMSKKLSSGSDSIVLDVKVGDGAFLKSKEDAEKLARIMVDIGNKFGKTTKAIITNMDQPLGYAVGNYLEVLEVIETLKGKGPKDIIELSIHFASVMISTSLNISFEDAKNLANNSLKDNSAYNKFIELVESQSKAKFTELKFKETKYTHELKSPKDGVIAKIKCQDIGEVALEVGAGRKIKNEKIDLYSGLILAKKVSDKVSKGDLLVTLYSNKPIEEETIKKLNDSFIIKDKSENKKLIISAVN